MGCYVEIAIATFHKSLKTQEEGRVIRVIYMNFTIRTCKRQSRMTSTFRQMYSFSFILFYLTGALENVQMYYFKVYPFNFYPRLALDKVTKVNSILLNLLFILFL